MFNTSGAYNAATSQGLADVDRQEEASELSGSEEDRIAHASNMEFQYTFLLYAVRAPSVYEQSLSTPAAFPYAI